jgi:predicted CopG family antitoxin
MVRTVRLDKDTEKSLKEVARATGQSPSEVIRESIRIRAAQLRSLPKDHPWASYAGKVAGRGRSLARRSSEEFLRNLLEKKKAGRL